MTRGSKMKFNDKIVIKLKCERYENSQNQSNNIMFSIWQQFLQVIFRIKFYIFYSHKFAFNTFIYKLHDFLQEKKLIFDTRTNHPCPISSYFFKISSMKRNNIRKSR